MARRFLARVKQAKLNAAQAAALVITFVQDIKYQIPKEEPFGVRPPTLVMKEGHGDCDSKSLLAHMILRELGVDSVLISSTAHKHTMLGVALPSGGTTFTFKSRRYAFVETTAKRAPIGYIDPRLLRPNDWQVVVMRYKGPQMTGAAESEEVPKKAPKPTPKPAPQKTKKPPRPEDIIRGVRIRIDR